MPSRCSPEALRKLFRGSREALSEASRSSPVLSPKLGERGFVEALQRSLELPRSSLGGSPQP
eukprot:1432809-Alexandrium_andersonii.AAC.1